MAKIVLRCINVASLTVGIVGGRAVVVWWFVSEVVEERLDDHHHPSCTERESCSGEDYAWRKNIAGKVLTKGRESVWRIGHDVRVCRALRWLRVCACPPEEGHRAARFGLSPIVQGKKHLG